MISFSSYVSIHEYFLSFYFFSSWTTAVKVQTAVSQEQLSELHRNIYLNLPQRFTTAEGIGIAESYGMKEHAFKMFLKRHIGTLFRKENHGEYSK